MSTFHGRNRKYRGDNQRFIQFCVKLSPLELFAPINIFFYPDAEGEISKWGCSTTAISRSADVETAVLHVGVFDKMVNWKGFFYPGSFMFIMASLTLELWCLVPVEVLDTKTNSFIDFENHSYSRNWKKGEFVISEHLLARWTSLYYRTND